MPEPRILLCNVTFVGINFLSAGPSAPQSFGEERYLYKSPTYNRDFPAFVTPKQNNNGHQYDPEEALGAS